MTPEITVALIAAGPPTLAAVLAFLSSRSVKRSVGRLRVVNRHGK